MKKLLGIGVTLALILVVSMPVDAQVKQGKSRPLLTKQLMKGLVAPSCGGIKEGLAAAPADDKAWEDLAMKAALINEASYVLMEDGRCPDGDWAKAATTLRECSAAVLEKVAAKDSAGAQEAFTALTKACGACHKVHRKQQQ